MGFTFHALLGQPGSTPLDLFKYYVEDLKARFSDEKKIIKEILKEKNYEIQSGTSFETFAGIVCEDKRSSTLDAGNVKLTYNSLLEKAESREKERQKEESKKLKKIELELRELFMDYKSDEKTSWESVRLHIMDREPFLAVTEEQASKMFRDFQRDLSETCHHNHGKKKSKKSKKKKKVSSSSSESEMVERRSGRKRKDTDSSETEESEEERSRKKKKKKKKNKSRARTMSESRSPISSDAEEVYVKKSKKRKATPSLSPSPAKRSVGSPSSSPRRTRDSLSPQPKRRDREKGSEESFEEGELSEEELEKKRMLLLKQLQEDD